MKYPTKHLDGVFDPFQSNPFQSISIYFLYQLWASLGPKNVRIEDQGKGLHEKQLLPVPANLLCSRFLAWIMAVSTRLSFFDLGL
jgi:hypothetical protein